MSSSFFFFNDTATTEIYTLSLHDALPIWVSGAGRALKEGSLFVEVSEAMHAYGVGAHRHMPEMEQELARAAGRPVRSESTRLNSSHANISYAVFCLKKKKRRTQFYTRRGR